jgi:malate/lactate dehydrogenase
MRLYGSEIWSIKAGGHQKNNSSRDEIHEKNSRIHSDRLKNKYANCKGIKNNTNFGNITGIQEKLDTTCK